MHQIFNIAPAAWQLLPSCEWYWDFITRPSKVKYLTKKSLESHTLSQHDGIIGTAFEAPQHSTQRLVDTKNAITLVVTT